MQKIKSHHKIHWLGTFRGTDTDPREVGWCNTCQSEVYDGDGKHSVSTKPSTSGPTVPESRRREKGQHRLTLRLSDEDAKGLARVALPTEKTPQATLRRLIRAEIAKVDTESVVE